MTATPVTVINFAHPLSASSREQLTALSGSPIGDVHTIDAQVDLGSPLAAQIQALVDDVPLTGEQWQTQPLLVLLPGLSASTAVLLAELHGRIGHFPVVISMRRTTDVVPVYEVADLIDLQDVREAARRRRTM